MKKHIFRTGDLVIDKTDKKKDVGIVGHVKHWSLLDKHVDVYFRSNGNDCLGAPHCVAIKDLVLFKRREVVRNYWKYITRD